jgi:phage terminase small subunit
MPNDRPDPPSVLGRHGRRLWRELQTGLADSAEFDERETELLRLACAQADLVARIERELEGEPLTIEGRTGPRAHPLLARLESARLAEQRLLDRLDLSAPEAGVPMVRNQRARRAAQKRWAMKKATEEARRAAGT